MLAERKHVLIKEGAILSASTLNFIADRNKPARNKGALLPDGARCFGDSRRRTLWKEAHLLSPRDKSHKEGDDCVN